MPFANFVHLRVHSAYSLSEGAIHIEELVRLSCENKMPAVAVTDTSNMFGALEFSDTAAKSGVQPIIGCELHISGFNKDNCSPMVFLAKDDIGYRNILKLMSHAYLEGENTHIPQVPYSVLDKHSKGIIALTGGPAGPVGQLIMEGKLDHAKDILT